MYSPRSLLHRSRYPQHVGHLVCTAAKAPCETAKAERAAKDAERSADRKGQVGSGDRSERIRTYNFPQGRVTDHRINLTLYKLDKVIAGEALDEIVDALISEDQAERLSEIESGV